MYLHYNQCLVSHEAIPNSAKMKIQEGNNKIVISGILLMTARCFIKCRGLICITEYKNHNQCNVSSNS